MSGYTINVTLDPLTSAVLGPYAAARHQTRAEAIAAILYRQAAAMTGWPGQQGAEFERAWLREVEPAAAEIEEDVL